MYRSCVAVIVLDAYATGKPSWSNTAPNALLDASVCNTTGFVTSLESQDLTGGHNFFDLVECTLMFLSSMPRHVLLQRGNLCGAWDELCEIVDHSEQSLHPMLVVGSWHIEDCINFGFTPSPGNL